MNAQTFLISVSVLSASEHLVHIDHFLTSFHIHINLHLTPLPYIYSSQRLPTARQRLLELLLSWIRLYPGTLSDRSDYPAVFCALLLLSSALHLQQYPLALLCFFFCKDLDYTHIYVYVYMYTCIYVYTYICMALRTSSRHSYSCLPSAYLSGICRGGAGAADGLFLGAPAAPGCRVERPHYLRPQVCTAGPSAAPKCL